MSGRTLRIRLLGGFAVEIDGEEIAETEWTQRRAADLVKLLALARRHRLTREQVIEALWPDLDPTAGAANVRKAAHRTRRILGVDDAVVLDKGMVALAPGWSLETDVERFDSGVAAAERNDDVTGYRQAASLYGGDLLPDDRYAEWCDSERGRLRLRYLEILAAGELWGRLVDESPTDERAHQEIMRGHVKNGDRGAAIRQFEQLQKNLREHLGVGPDPTSVELYEEVLAMEGRDAPTPAERARALLAWGVVHWKRQDLAEAKRTAEEARALAIDAGLGRELSDASELLGLVAYAQGAWREVFGAEFIETIRETPELAPFVLDSHMCMNEFALWEVDGVDTMAEFAEEILVTTADFESPQGRALGLLMRAEAELLRAGETGSIGRDLVESAELHQQADSITGWSLAQERLAQLVTQRGDSAAGRGLHERALELAARGPTYRHLALFIYGGMLDGVDEADVDTAMRLVTQGEEVGSEIDVCDPCSMGFWIGATMACARTGDTDRARRHLREAERVVQMWKQGPWHAAVKEARSELLLGEGADRGEVIDLLERAAEQYRAAHRPRETSRCLRKAAALH